MDLRQLQYVEAVARNANFTRAAEELHVAQPALSLAVRKLEHELGLRLFERTSRRVDITDAGRAFVGRAHRILGEVDSLAYEMGEFAGGALGRVRIGCWYHLEPNLPELLRTFVHANPFVDFSIVEEPSPVMLESLRDGELDVVWAVLTPEMDLGGLESVTVREEALAIGVAPGSGLSDGKAISHAMLANQACVMPRTGTVVRYWLDQLLERKGIPVRVAIETNEFAAMVRFASLGLGIAPLTRSLAAALNDEITIIDIEDPPTFTVDLTWNPTAYRGSAAEAFLRLAREALAPGEADGHADASGQGKVSPTT